MGKHDEVMRTEGQGPSEPECHNNRRPDRVVKGKGERPRDHKPGPAFVLPAVHRAAIDQGRLRRAGTGQLRGEPAQQAPGPAAGLVLPPRAGAERADTGAEDDRGGSEVPGEADRLRWQRRCQRWWVG